MVGSVRLPDWFGGLVDGSGWCRGLLVSEAAIMGWVTNAQPIANGLIDLDPARFLVFEAAPSEYGSLSCWG